ncbi:MAG: helix-turn-helix domain-containing protein [Roseovarius sp.]
MLAEIDLMIRGAVIGIAALTFLILVANPQTRAKSWPTGAIAITLAGMMTKSREISDVWSHSAESPATIASHFMPLALTWLVLEIFLDRPDRLAVRTPLLGLAGFIVALCFVPLDVSVLHTALDLILLVVLFVVVLNSAKGDLVENRRSFRVVFILLVTVFGITKVLTDVYIDPAIRPIWLPTAFASGVLLIKLVFGYWALRPGSGLWVADETPAPRMQTDAVDQIDTHLLTQIDRAMQDELWRREGLTIGAMASELGVPEHRLRHAINRDLGYRNFPAFVNGYRIDAAKAALSAPENAQKTILEIAYDVGFASLGPFNKAFRAMTGKSPRDFRRSAGHDPSIAA